MTALATVADIEDRLGRSLTAEEERRVDALLEDASAVVRLHTGRQFATGEVTTRMRAARRRVRLTQGPVTAVTAVTDLDGRDVPYAWDGLDLVVVWPAEYADGFERDVPSIFPTALDVTYTVGPDAVPDPIRAVVCQVAGRALGKPADQGGLQQESIAGYSYQVGSAAAAGPMGLLADERAVLDRYRRVGGVVWGGAA